MAHSFRTLQAAIPKERRERTLRRVRETIDGITLNEIRGNLNYTQNDLAQRLKKTQGEISLMEKRGDLKVSTLSEYVNSMGGRLELRAIFDDRAFNVRLPKAATATATLGGKPTAAEKKPKRKRA